MDITATPAASATVLALKGRLDGLASPAVDQQVDALLAAGTRAVVFDCSGLDYVSSAGLRAFLTAAKKLKSAGGRAAFAALSVPVREVFELSGFLEVLEIHPTVSAATA